ncbi:hypothetical protein [uncultured Parabacteroides sp.]|uniref:hypothetical protein n=1 Tax=uncultured Parabacteroides sp. TaxID=512312 RepID=UPI0025DCDAB3|nr:hypothetical protein [uncultured Parabacteroides sp.]
MKTVAAAMKTVVMATSPRNFFQIIETLPVFVSLQALLQKLRFIALPAFPVSGNQIARFFRPPAHLALLLSVKMMKIVKRVNSKRIRISDEIEK